MKNILYSINKQTEKNETFKCPSCGATCYSSEDYCKECSFDLNSYKNILFNYNVHLNNAINFSNKKEYFEALISILKFLGNNPFDEYGNKLYIYILIKLDKIEKAKQELENFEKLFPLSNWVFEIDKVGLSNIEMPIKNSKMFVPTKIEDSLKELNQFYIDYKNKNNDECLNLILHYFDFMRLLNEDNLIKNQNIVKTFDKNFLKFLSKKEISIESFDGLGYEELSDGQLNTIDVIGVFEDLNIGNNRIKTIYPSVFLRSKMIYKQKVLINKKGEK